MERDYSTLRVEGFNRSGSTFLVGLLKESFPDLNIPYFDHSTAKLRYPNTFVSVRTPVESIPSIKNLLGEKDWGSVSRWYIRYYKAIKKNIDTLHIIDFVELTSSPSIIVNKISNIIGVKPSQFNLDKIFKNASKSSYEKNYSIPLLDECLALYEEVKGRAI